MKDKRAELVGISTDYKTRETLLTFRVEDCSPASAEEMTGKALRLDAVMWRDKRSREANSYYWTLLAKLAGKLGRSNVSLHNEMIAKYGEPMPVLCGERVYVSLPDNEAVEKWVEENETVHLRPTSQVINGHRTYRLMLGSSYYDTAEFSRLLDGLIEDCKAVGIETMTPAEVERMMAHYVPAEHLTKRHDEVLPVRAERVHRPA